MPRHGHRYWQPQYQNRERSARCMNDMELGWLAGFFDGEGWIASRNNGRGITLAIENSDLDLLERVLQYTGEGHISGPRTRSPKRKSTWTWQVTDWPGSSRLLLAIYPLLSDRRKARVLELMPILEYGPPGHRKIMENDQLRLGDW